MGPKRLVVCCDGTWNTPDEVTDGKPAQTNVARIARAIAPVDARGTEQRVYYRKGVGTGRFDHFLGGALGWGLSRNVQDAYMFLVDNYRVGDEIFLFGFSRGAYTVRSVVGLIRNSGLLRRRHAGKLGEAYALYRDRGEDSHPRAAEAELFRRSFSREVRIRFLGVWDTVGALGIPLELPGIQLVNERWQFHDVKLSTSVDNAFQALAIDERRKPFTPAIWEQQPGAQAVDQRLEQVWFAGVHSDVGGGYPQTGLSDVALAWMRNRAGECGLAVDFEAARIPLRPDGDAPLHDSMTPYYRLLGELVRPMPVPRTDAEGTPLVTREKVIDLAVRRMAASAGAYRPPNLLAFVRAGGPQTKA
jgi:uncharacterized protein (DUF2235 family)